MRNEIIEKTKQLIEQYEVDLKEEKVVYENPKSNQKKKQSKKGKKNE